MEHGLRWYHFCFAALLCGLIGITYWWMYDFFSFGRFLSFTEYLEHIVQRHHGLAVIAYSAIYALIAAIGIPITVGISIIGGFVFGCLEAFVYSVLASTFGSIIAFVVIRRWASPFIERRYGKFLEKFRYYFQQSAFYYVVALQLLPIVPFGAITALAALSSMHLLSFACALFLGSMPGNWVYACTGSHLKVLARTGMTSSSSNRTLFFFSLLGLAVLVYAFISTFKMWKKKESSF